ncbi:family 20 glycosylhydrolase [Cohnella zeiphila]|uniref:beta-N-acetylhexosaminidase n=1 Tax=Cohnella zeiphila TaxID=2761120 RepID=A0A7X0SM39_9BACL|nr:family 20 glycosylhydrolase [Cohnella zeiphila]MBB6731339.1 family 20 glycosylhydrolase [Cohnella zeiphila]
MGNFNSYESFQDEGAYLTTDTRIEGGGDVLISPIKEASLQGNRPHAFKAVRFVPHLDERLIGRIREQFGEVYKEDEDGYAVEIEEDEIRISAATARGWMYGACTLRQIGENGFFRYGIVYNVPLCSFRGLKVYLPAADDVDFFKSFVDMACYYRYNHLVVEVGGAMEYKRHPEINEGWVAYCEEMREYSGKAAEIQARFDWGKNSIHCENGGGRWLTQASVRELVAYCKDRGLNVIPEVPSLSHSDYLLIRHPELAERSYDPYPDTYCPSNPDSYKLLFDVLDEVADVFEPEIIHIGHDEYYSIAICERCRGKDPAAIYAEDVNRIRDYLAGKGIRTMMWGDKLLNAVAKDGKKYGGAGSPATYPAIDKIASDVEVMHWYWSIHREWDEQYHSRGLSVVYGNFEGPGIPEWSRRLSRGVKGASISNWSALNENYMQRNGIFFNMVYGCRMFWRDEYDETRFPAMAEKVFAELYRYRNRKILAGPHIEITHGTAFHREFEFFFDGKFIEPGEDHLGDYTVTFEDGSVVSCPVDYGTNITGFDRSWTLRWGESFDVYEFDRSLIEVSYTALPVREGAITWCIIAIPNPFPEKKIASVEFQPKKNTDARVILSKFAVKG